ncbi:lysophospholipid acyltransferase family protein [bacterium]|nr:lysophospholipid acyltransferase family protein [bacterium]
MTWRAVIRRFRRDGAYCLILIFVWFFRLIPRKMAIAIGSLLGWIAPFFARKELRLAKEHLSMAFGSEKDPREINRLAHGMFRYLVLNFVDTVRLNAMKPDEIKAMCIPHDIDRYERLMEAGKGVIGLSGHMGCWELMGTYLALLGFPVDAVARKLYDPRLERLLIRSREQGGMNVISRGENTREILRAIKGGHLIGMLVDQDMNIKGEFIEFFGRPAYTAVAPAFLSLRYGVPIIPLFTCRDSNHYHHIYAGEPLHIEPTGDMEHDVRELTALCSKATEDFIREYPEQWVWFHRRWKTTPTPENEK